MSIINRLASSLDRRDEIPNQELAQEIVAIQDRVAIQELIENLSNKKAIQNDCIKVLYEIGKQSPDLIANYHPNFLNLLEHKNNRLQWGAMAALETILPERPKEIYVALPRILAATDIGSVITRDHAVNILIQFCKMEHYQNDAFQLLKEQLLNSPPNQLPMYAERSLPIIKAANKDLFLETLQAKLEEIEKASKRKRVEKVIQKIQKLSF